MPRSNWNPIEKTWSESAYQEITQAFPEKRISRAVALCVWCYAQDPDASVNDIEAHAQGDLNLRGAADGKKIGSHARRQARQVLGLTGRKRSTSRKGRKDANLSAIEKAILARFQESMSLVSEYVKLADELAAAQKAFDAARAALHEIPADQMQTITEADPDVAKVLMDEGILSATDSTPPGVGATRADWSEGSSEARPADAWPRIAN